MIIKVVERFARRRDCLLLAALTILLMWAASEFQLSLASALVETRRLHPAQHEFSRHQDVESNQKFLTGGWNGWRDKLAKAGFVPTAIYVTDLLGNPTGGQRQGFQYAGRLDFDFDFNLEKLADLEGLKFHFSTSWSSGRDLSSEDIGNLFPASQIFDGDSMRLAALDLEQSLFDGKFNYKVGRIGTGDDFITSPIYQNFVNAFVNSSPYSMFVNIPSFTTFPVMTWGLAFNVKPVEDFYAMAGAYNSDPTLGRNSAYGVDFSFSGEVFAIGEVGYLRNQTKSSTGLPGNYKFGAYYDSSSYQDLSSPLENVQGNYGFYLLIDQMVYREGEANDPQGLTPFAAFTFSPSDRNTLPFFFSAGVSYQGLFPGRDKDLTAFGLGYGTFSRHLAGQNFEMVLEWFHEFAVTPWLTLQPDIQYIIKPNGDDTIPNALVLGLQLGINF